jgi:hypothetical protein
VKRQPHARPRLKARLLRIVGRKPKPPVVEERTRSSLQPHVDMDLPYLIATDKQVWGSTDDGTDAVLFAQRLCDVVDVGERVVVTFVGIVVWTGQGQGSSRV